MSNNSTILEMVELNEIGEGFAVTLTYRLIKLLIYLGIQILTNKNIEKLKKQYPDLGDEFDDTIDRLIEDQKEIDKKMKYIKNIKKQVGLVQAKKRIKELKEIITEDIELVDNFIFIIKNRFTSKYGPVSKLIEYRKVLIKFDKQCNKILYKI